MAKRKTVSYKLVRFDELSPNFPVKVFKTVQDWAFDPVERDIKLNIIAKLNKSGRGALGDTVRHDIKGGIKRRRTTEGDKKFEKTNTMIVQFKAGSGESLQSNVGGKFANVPYATVQERGSFDLPGLVLTPKTTRFLFIPVDPFWETLRGQGQVLKASGQYRVTKNLMVVRIADGQVVAKLAPSLYLKPTPYMEPAIKKNLPKLRKTLKEELKSENLTDK